MKSLRFRLILWFSCSVVVVFAAFAALTYRALDVELRRKSVARDYPGHPDWNLHGSFSDDEMRDITQELMEAWLGYGTPMVLLALGVGWWLSRKSMEPIAEVNRQLKGVDPASLGRRIEISEVDEEFRDLVSHVNDLLARIQLSFDEMREYAAKVAHELRTPLAILRLKVEQADNRITPDLAEELQDELSRLSHVVDQSLLIAKAGQGRLQFERRDIDLVELISDITQDFRLVASAAARTVRLEVPPHCNIRCDPKYLKQILHGLLTNAIKHGVGEVRIRVRSHANRCSLLMLNQVAPTQSAPATLGLGLRVTRAIVSAEATMRHSHRKLGSFYVARLTFEKGSDRAHAMPERLDPLAAAGSEFVI